MKQTQTQKNCSNEQPKPLEKINLTNVQIWMLKNAYEQTTIKQVTKRLKRLTKTCDTTNPEAVKIYIASLNVSNAYKESLIETYAIYMRSVNQQWNQPFYDRYDKKRKAPKEELIDFIISHARPVMKLKLSMEKDLGTRPVELFWLKVGDIDQETGLASITGAKHTIGREGKLKIATLQQLRIYLEKNQLKLNDHIFKGTSDNMSATYRTLRNRLAKKYGRPELKQIQLYDFRRFFASKAYHLTGKELLVKQLLGHKDFRSTEKYISLFDNNTASWIGIKAVTDEEKQKCIEEDYTHVTTETNGAMWFKKPR
jgi:integrase